MRKCFPWNKLALLSPAVPIPQFYPTNISWTPHLARHSADTAHALMPQPHEPMMTMWPICYHSYAIGATGTESNWVWWKNQQEESVAFEVDLKRKTETGHRRVTMAPTGILWCSVTSAQDRSTWNKWGLGRRLGLIRKLR